MRMPGRVSAAIEILTDIFVRHRPASEALRDWGKSHRFAGGGDRHAIGTLVYDALRKKASAANRMGSDAPRALVLATLRTQWNLGVDEINALSIGEHAPSALNDEERKALQRDVSNAPIWIAADIPQWLEPHYTRAFGGDAAAQGASLATAADPLAQRQDARRETSDGESRQENAGR